MKFIWVLRCPSCSSTFSPKEENWDEEIECPRCSYSNVVSHENYDEPEKPLLEIVRDAPATI